MAMIPVTNLKGITILVVDDNADNVDVLATFLRACGAGVLTAGTGVEALTFLVGDPMIDLLVTDLAMPGLNGIGMVRCLRAQPQLDELATTVKRLTAVRAAT